MQNTRNAWTLWNHLKELVLTAKWDEIHHFSWELNTTITVFQYMYFYWDSTSSLGRPKYDFKKTSIYGCIFN